MGRGKRASLTVARELPLSDAPRQKRTPPMSFGPALAVDPAAVVPPDAYVIETLCQFKNQIDGGKPEFHAALNAALAMPSWSPTGKEAGAQAILDLCDKKTGEMFETHEVQGASDLEGSELSWLVGMVLEDYDGRLTTCHRCGRDCCAELAHDLEGQTWGDACCWDERLRAVQ